MTQDSNESTQQKRSESEIYDRQIRLWGAEAQVRHHKRPRTGVVIPPPRFWWWWLLLSALFRHQSAWTESPGFSSDDAPSVDLRSNDRLLTHSLSLSLKRPK